MLYIGANGFCHLLKREIGVNPMLSRNCKWGIYTTVTVVELWEDV